MRISAYTLLVLAKSGTDKEAVKAWSAYEALIPYSSDRLTVKVWHHGNTYQVGLTLR